MSLSKLTSRSVTGELDPDDRGGPITSPKVSLWDKALLALPRRGVVREPFADRMRSAFLKPPAPGTPAGPTEPPSVEELEATARSANDKERLIGLIAAPFAAAIGFLITAALIDNDPAALLKNGQANKLHVSVGLYHEVLVALLVLSLVMLLTALLRKRLYLGIAAALYGLTVFNLHYWGFGVPFIMFGAWLMVRAYRIQRSLKEATGTTASGLGGHRLDSGARPRPNKRYTPPAASRRR